MLLLWSGGCDSTLVLCNALAEGKEVRTIGISHTNVHSSEHMKQAREAIRKRLLKKYTWTHNEVFITHEVGFDIADTKGLGLLQPIIWMSAAAQFLDKEEDLCLAYIKGDDIWHYIQYVQTMFNGFQGLTNRTGSLLIPSEWTSKAQVIAELQRDWLDILRKCWWCEAPDKNDECGACASCMTHATALYQIKNNQDYYLSKEKTQ